VLWPFVMFHFTISLHVSTTAKDISLSTIIPRHPHLIFLHYATVDFVMAICHFSHVKKHWLIDWLIDWLTVWLMMNRAVFSASASFQLQASTDRSAALVLATAVNNNFCPALLSAVSTGCSKKLHKVYAPQFCNRTSQSHAVFSKMFRKKLFTR